MKYLFWGKSLLRKNATICMNLYLTCSLFVHFTSSKPDNYDVSDVTYCVFFGYSLYIAPKHGDFTIDCKFYLRRAVKKKKRSARGARSFRALNRLKRELFTTGIPIRKYCAIISYRQVKSVSPRHSSKHSCLVATIWCPLTKPNSRWFWTRSMHHALSQGFTPKQLF